jgi:hypothetical protein
MNLFKKVWLFLRTSRRVGAFQRAREKGISIEQARAYSDRLYPPTPHEVAHEERLRREELRKDILDTAQKMAVSDEVNLRSLPPERQMEYAERAAKALNIKLE